MPGSMRRYSGTMEQPPPRRDAMDRRHSNASDTSLPDTNHIRQLSQENIEYIPTRISKVTATKPAANPLQFIKVGPASLYKSAQEQLKKVEEIKKVTKEVRDEAEDWQSNLDNWKSSRRKRQEHIIERVVEVKKIEMEEYDRNRRRSKTFNEMMEERNSRGRKGSFVLYKDDDANDLSDLGISTSSGKSSISEEYGNDNHQDNSDKEDIDRHLHENHNGKQGKNGHHDDDGSSIATVSSPEPEEYTYERAIQGYVNFTETRVKSRPATVRSNLNNSREEVNDIHNFKTSTEKLSNGHHGKSLPSPPHTPRRQSAAKIEEKLSALEKRRRSSTELNSSVNNDRRIPIAKGDVLKRRELFERACELNEPVPKPSRRLSEDFAGSKVNQERLVHVGKQSDKTESAGTKETNSETSSRLSGGVSSPVKDKQKSVENISGKEAAQSRHRLSNGELPPAPPVQKRSSKLEKQESGEKKVQTVANHVPSDLSQSIKERLSTLDSTCNKDNNRKIIPDRDPGFQAKLTNFCNAEEPDKMLNGVSKSTKGPEVSSERSSSPEEDIIYETKRKFHRSLDSLDVEGSSDAGNEAFERVQSLEDLECCSHARNYPASASSTEMLVFSSQSGDTDREDSGIHTADVSCSVSQADEPVEDGEIIASINSVVPHLETNSSGADVYHLEVEIVNQKHSGNRGIDQHSPVPVQSDKLSLEATEMATAYVDVKGSGDNSLESPTSPVVADLPDSKSKAEPQQPEKDAVTTRIASEEPKVYNDKCDSTIDVQHKSGENKIISEKVNNIKQEEIVISKDCTNSQQLPSSQNFAQNVPIEVKDEKKPPSPILNSKLGNQSEDEVFLPISTSQIPPLNLSSDVEIVAGLAFPLGPPTSTEPPKEKPPPPPTELSDDEVPPVTNLKRLDSTKRIKKEIRRKRSDFLGIEGGNDDSYLEPELKVAPPPDMTTFLVEERRSEQQLYRQSICSETDSNHGETTDSRDSGVELDRAHSDDWNGKLSSTPEVLSAQHSRQNSDIYGTASITSEEDEIMKKEREIIEILEKEEQWRYRNNKTAEEKDIGEKLAVKLHQLEQEKMRLEWERSEEENKKREEEMRLKAKEQELRQQESLIASPTKRPSVTGKEERVITASGEALQAERERLQRENEELQRQKETLQLRESQQLRHAQMQQHWGSTKVLPHQQWSNENTGLPPTHLSLQDISMAPAGNVNSYHLSTAPTVQSTAPLNYRLSLPDLQQEEELQNQQSPVRQSSIMPSPRVNPNRRPPPPIPPAKPLRAVSQEQRERENSIRNSRMPSADSIPQHVESNHAHHASTPAHVGSQPISRQTLQALSAVPKSRFISNDMWMQVKKKPETQRSGGRESTYNYQHWLIQEAEHRRITEQQQRNAVSPRKPSPPHAHPPHQQSWNVLQPQPTPQPRQDKPLPDSIIQTLTQRVQNRVGMLDSKNAAASRRRLEESPCRESQPQAPPAGHIPSSGALQSTNPALNSGDSQEKMLSVSGKKKCSHCGEELGRGAAMIIESLRLFYHIDCFKCCVCHVQLGDGLMGTDVRVRNNKLHCHNCYSSDDGVKFSCV